MNKWILGSLVLSLSLTASGEPLRQPFDKLKKQINIMSDIITSSLSQDAELKRYGTSVEGYYLKSQGAVFEVGTANRYSRLMGMFGKDVDVGLAIAGGLSPEAPVAPIPPVAPVVISSDDGTIEVEVPSDLEAYEEAMESWGERIEQTRELRESQREMAYEVRSLARKKRDLEFELRHAQKDRMAELKKELAGLEKEMAALERKSDELSARAEAQEKALSEKKKARAEKIKQASERYFVSLDNAIADTLCSYGAGLRGLAKNEYVTFVIALGKQKGDGPVKKIHTFKKQDIIACVMQDKTPQQLLQSAQSYYY